jgi:NADH-quinone oxidoreductase subunit A
VLYEFASALVIIALAFLIVPLTLGVGSFFRPSHPYKYKNMTYECGEIPVGTSWVRFNIRFYMVAIVFLIFDVEVLFMLPIATLYKSWVAQGMGLRVFVEAAIFMAILVVGLAYIWRKGDLEWIRAYRRIVSPKPRSAIYGAPQPDVPQGLGT